MPGVGWKKLITEERITADIHRPVGWYTIAVSLVSINASARFGLNNVFAEGIGNVTFYATTTSTSESQINIISKSGKGPFPIENIRIKTDPDGIGAALQFYNNSEDNRFSLILFGDNEGNGVGNWELIDFLPDNDNPGEDYNLNNTQWSNFNVSTIIDANTVNLGLSTTGTLLSKELKIGEYLKLPLNDLDDTTTDDFVTFTPSISYDNTPPGNVFNSNLQNQDHCYLSTVNNITVDYDIESKLGSPQIITQFKIYFSKYAQSCRKVKILGSNDGSTFAQIFEEPEATVPSDTNAMVIRTVPFTNTTAYSHYRLEILKDFCVTPNNFYGVNLIEIEYFTGFSSLIKDSKLTTDSIVLSNNTAGTTSDDIVVRDSSGNLKTISNSMPTNNNQLSNGAGYITSADGGNAQTLDSIDSNAFINETHTQHSAANLAVGWYTIAVIPNGRAHARFGIRDTASSRHASVTFYATHHYGNGNQLTVLTNGKYKTAVFSNIRIKKLNTFDGAALQVYISNTSNSVVAYMLGDNYQSVGWALKDWIPDATNPGINTGVNSSGGWNLYTTAAQVALADFQQGMAVTPGNISGSFIGDGSGLTNVCGKRVHLSTTTNNVDYPIPFQFGTTTAAGCMDLAKDSASDFTYNPSLNTLKVPRISTDTITATTINTKVLRYQEFTADWGTSTQKRYLPLSNAYYVETATTNQYYSRYIFTDDVAVSDVKIEMRMERSMNFKLEVLHHPLGGTLSSGFNQFNSNGFVYNNSNVFEYVLDSGPEGGFNKGDFLYIAIDPTTGTSPGEVNGHLIICYDNEQTLTPGTNTAPNPNPVASDKE